MTLPPARAPAPLPQSAPPPAPQAVFLHGSLLRHLMRMSLTGAFGLFAIQVSELLALFYIGRAAGVTEIAALAVALVVYQCLFLSNIGLSIAIGAVIAAGAVDDDRATQRRRAGQAVVLSFLISTACALAVLAFAEPILDIFGLEPESRSAALRLIYLILPLNGVQMISMAYGSILRGQGRPDLALAVTLAGAGTTLILDPVLILLAGWGVDGLVAALWAGRMAQIGAGLILLRGCLRLGPGAPGETGANARALLTIAAPAAVAVAAVPVGDALLQSFLAGFGDAARQALLVGTKIGFFAFGIMVLVPASAGIMIAQIHRAGDLDRALALIRLLAVCLTVYVLAAGLALSAAAPRLLPLFDVAPGSAMALARTYLALAGLAWLGHLFSNGANAILQNTGRARYSMGLSWARITVGLLPCWLAGTLTGRPEAAILGYALGMGVFGAAALAGVYAMLWHERDRATAQTPKPAAPTAKPPG